MASFLTLKGEREMKGTIWLVRTLVKVQDEIWAARAGKPGTAPAWSSLCGDMPLYDGGDADLTSSCGESVREE